MFVFLHSSVELAGVFAMAVGVAMLIAGALVACRTFFARRSLPVVRFFLYLGVFTTIKEHLEVGNRVVNSYGST